MVIDFETGLLSWYFCLETVSEFRLVSSVLSFTEKLSHDNPPPDGFLLSAIWIWGWGDGEWGGGGAGERVGGGAEIQGYGLREEGGGAAGPMASGGVASGDGWEAEEGAT
jgi:hypothetical protein